MAQCISDVKSRLMCFYYDEIVTIFPACERLILLRTDPKEMRDYSILLYHCGLYKQALEFLKLYQDMKVSFMVHLNMQIRSLFLRIGTNMFSELFPEFFRAKSVNRSS